LYVELNTQNNTLVRGNLFSRNGVHIPSIIPSYSTLIFEAIMKSLLKSYCSTLRG
jgi:hypothetical protein